jgi:hypothetical protein
MQLGNEMALALCEKPVGALSWQPPTIDHVNEAEFANEGNDPQLQEEDFEEYTR